MHRQTSRNPASVDAIDCIVSTNDLALENEVLNQEHEQRRPSNSSRRDQTSKRLNENIMHRSTRHAPPSVTRKRHSSPSPLSSSTSRTHHHHYYPSQRHPRVSSPSPSPPPPSSSRHHRSSRPIPSTKRPHSHSRSPYERRAPTQRSRPQSSKERTIDTVLSTTDEQIIPKKNDKITPNQENTDLSLVSEDESTKINDIRSNGITTNESTSSITTTTTNNKLHSTPSLPILQPNSNDSILDMSNIVQDCELSIFAKSALSHTNTNSILSTSMIHTNNLMQTIDLISKYKMMQALPSNNSQVDACSKDILIIIQKQIELQKIEIDHREREIKLRERELIEREKRFNDKSNDTTNMVSVSLEPSVIIKPTIIEEKSQQQSELIVNQDVKNVLSQEESVAKSILPSIDISKVNVINQNDHDQPSVTRKNSGKSRFSKAVVDPSIFASRQKPVLDLYSDDIDDNQLSLSINTNNSLKKPIISKILAPSESTISIVDTDLKVTSSNSCRKVEFQSGNIDKTITSKGSSHDLRLTLSKNRNKQHSNDDDDGTNGNQSINHDGEQTLTTTSSKINLNKDDKQQSHDYHQQRSITSTSIETIIDDNNDKRDNRRHQQQQQQQQRTNTNRQQQQQYSGQNSSSTIINSNERSYTHGSIPQQQQQQQSKYSSKQKHHESDDLRSRLFEQKYPKSSRTTHRNNY